MRVTRAEGLGFCFGVRRAIEMTSAAAQTRGSLFTLGAVVHNARVAEALAKEGARPVATLDLVPPGAWVAITAHGAGPDVIEGIARRGLHLVDATCPIVRRAQEEAASLAEAGFRVVVYGDERHPEVRGILGWTRGRGQASLSAAIEPEQGEKGLALLAQTTARRRDFSEFVREIVERHPERIFEVRVIDTTCPEPARRYEAAQDLARAVEVMVIVGSPTSANTRRLADAAREAGVPAYSVESAEDIVPAWFLGLEHCGVTAGTSTPAEAVDEVVTRLGTFGEA